MSGPYRILVTGTRAPLDEAQERLVADELRRAAEGRTGVVVVHGACPTGVDAFVDELCRDLNIATESHPADWRQHGKAAGPLRNRAMVEAGAAVCLAFPLGPSRGTRGCATLARAADIETREVELA